MNFAGKKILFLSPQFFGYEKAITDRLRELGAEVDFYNERPSDSVWSKGIIRIRSDLYQAKINSYYQKILTETENCNYDFFLLIKGETVPVFFLEKFKVFHPNTVKIFYSYDAVSEYPKFLKLYPFFDKNFTFEPSDGKEYGLHFRPLFFLNEYKNTADLPLKYQIAFIGSAHTDRYLIGEKVKNLAEKLDLKAFFFYYAPGKTAFRLKKIFDRNLKKFDTKKLSFKKLSHSEIAEIYQQTFSVLDINKPFQHGLTMRTFETLASGKKLLTTNPDIRNYPFYDPQNILILDRNQMEINLQFFQSEFSQLNRETLEMMSLDSWIRCLFVENQDNYWAMNT